MNRLPLDAEVPSELKRWLIAVFPNFALEFKAGDEVHSVHEVFLVFTPFFGRAAPTATDTQLKRLSEFLNEATQRGGPLQNAIDTCFLEHLHQISATHYLKPLLGPHARALLRQ